MPPNRVWLFLCAVILADLPFAVRGQALPMNAWGGAVSNRWEDAGNWSAGHIPNSTEEVLIEKDQTVVATAPITCSSLHVSKGNLVASGDLDLSTGLFDPGTTFTLAGSSGRRLKGALTCLGTFVWAGGDIDGQLNGTESSSIFFHSGAVFVDQANAAVIRNHLAISVLFSTYRKEGGTSEIADASLEFTNIDQSAGTTHIAGGRLHLSGSHGGVFQGGMLDGSGTITGSLTFSGGTLALDHFPGQTLTVHGDVTLRSGSTLAVTAGSASPSDLSRLVVNGTVNLGGTLSFSTTAGFTPAWLARFPFVSALSVTGTFDAGQFPPPPESTHYDVSYKPTAAEVCVVPPPFPGWQYAHFGGSTDPAIVGETADPDADGLPNLLEYALGSNPLAPETTDNPAVFIKEEVGDMMTWSYLCMTYRQPVAASAVELIPEISNDLTTWGSGLSSLEVRSDTISDSVRTITVRGLFPISFNPRQFFRLRAVRVQ